jgi:Protein-arginine deiminase (PAD)/Protein-arginine deiminase (PAD) middle domain
MDVGQDASSLKRARDDSSSSDGQIGKSDTKCARVGATLTVTVQDPAMQVVATARIVAVNTDTNALQNLQNGVAADVVPGTYTIRAYADWYLPAPRVVAAVVIAARDEAQRSLTLTEIRYHLHVDADRDGAIDDNRANLDQWTWGPAGRGAIMLCNNDDDDHLGQAGHGTSDNADEVINHNQDPAEIAPLEIRRDGNLAPAGWTATLGIAGGHHVRARLFATRANNAASIAGPAQAVSNAINLNFASQVCGIEAIAYSSANFNGQIDVELTVQSPGMNAALDAAQGQVTYTEQAAFRVAPWMMPSHLDAVQRAYVADLGPDNLALRQELALRVANVVAVPAATHNGDRWLQDCMEIGYNNLPSYGINAVLQSPRGNDLRAFVPTLLGEDLGYWNPSAQTNGTTYDSFGNLEVTPPVPNYPFGRIYYSNGTVADPFDQDVAQFLAAQRVQAPFTVDATWLTVGHVDEMLSIVPAAGPLGFRVLIASARRAYDILDNIPALQRGAVRMFRGREYWRKALFANPTEWLNIRYNAEVTVAQFLQDALFNQELAATLRSGAAAFPGLTRAIATDQALLNVYNGNNDTDLRVADFDDGASLRQYNLNTCQPALDAARTAVRNALGIQDADFIHVPVLFSSAKMGRMMAGALSADMVNMIVFGTDCVVPRPFGPEQGGAGVQHDLFAQDLQQNLTAIGVTTHFVDDWDAYHVKHGEVHCGTNVIRTPAARPAWWTFV